jgi:hypothetical protein
MLFFNVMETVNQSDEGTLIRVNYDIDTAYANPDCVNFTDLLCVQVNVRPPLPGISSFDSWSVLIDKSAHWNGKDWKIFMAQPIENGDSCLIMLHRE